MTWRHKVEATIYVPSREAGTDPSFAALEGNSSLSQATGAQNCVKIRFCCSGPHLPPLMDQPSKLMIPAMREAVKNPRGSFSPFLTTLVEVNFRCLISMQTRSVPQMGGLLVRQLGCPNKKPWRGGSNHKGSPFRGAGVSIPAGLGSVRPLFFLDVDSHLRTVSSHRRERSLESLSCPLRTWIPP